MGQAELPSTGPARARPVTATQHLRPYPSPTTTHLMACMMKTCLSRLHEEDTPTRRRQNWTFTEIRRENLQTSGGNVTTKPRRSQLRVDESCACASWMRAKAVSFCGYGLRLEAGYRKSMSQNRANMRWIDSISSQAVIYFWKCRACVSSCKVQER